MRAIISLGSNLGDPEQNLLTAVRYLKLLSTAPLKSSSIWRTEPEGFSYEVPEFCNAIVIIESNLEPEALLNKLQIIETRMGRSRNIGKQYISRIIDLDIIDFGGQEVVSPTLILPHPRARFRNFVLLPLREVAPGFRFLNHPESLEELIATAPVKPVRKSSRLSL